MNSIDKMKSSKLMMHIINEMHKKGVVGEEDTITCLTLKIMLRLCENAHPTSSNILVSDNTGGGKDFITKNLCDLLCKKDVSYKHFTCLSDKFLNYHQPKIDKKRVSWDGWVLYLEDPPEDVIQSQAFKVMASGGTTIGTVKDQKDHEVKIDGKPVMLITSMKTSIDDEGQRRWDAVRVDMSNEVSKAVVDEVLLRVSGVEIPKPDDEFASLLRTLRSYKVIIPWAVKLTSIIQDPTVIERTQINKLIDYIKASAILHQYQRDIDDDGNLIADKEDFELARFAYIHLRNAEGNALNKKEEQVVFYLRNAGKPKKITEIVTDLTGVSKYWLYDNKDNMVNKGVLKSITKYDAISNRECEFLEDAGSINSKGRKVIPRADKVFGISGYYSSGEFYKEINENRKKRNLIPNFKEVL
jgi:hypothetical protein